jgi:hypothetical protein
MMLKGFYIDMVTAITRAPNRWRVARVSLNKDEFCLPVVNVSVFADKRQS